MTYCRPRVPGTTPVRLRVSPAPVQHGVGGGAVDEPVGRGGGQRAGGGWGSGAWAGRALAGVAASVSAAPVARAIEARMRFVLARSYSFCSTR